jgi:predicted ATPase
MAYRLRILLLSDTDFFSPTDPHPWREYQPRIFLGDSWRRNLETMQEDGPVDLVAFVGNVASSGKPQEYEVATEFITKTLQWLGLPRERLFVVPGVHDIDLGIASEVVEQVRRAVGPGNAQALSRWMAGGEPPAGVKANWREQILERQSAYRRWLSESLGRPSLLPGPGGHPTLGYRETIRLPDRPFDIHVVGLDSAWLRGEERHDIPSSYCLTEEQVWRLTLAPEGRELAGFRLGLVHHSVEALADKEVCTPLLAQGLDLLLRRNLNNQENANKVGCQLLEVSLDEAGRPQEYRLRVRLWAHGQLWHDDEGSLYPESRKGKVAWEHAPENTLSWPLTNLAYKAALWEEAYKITNDTTALLEAREPEGPALELRTRILPELERRGERYGVSEFRMALWGQRPEFFIQSLQIRNLKNITDLSIDFKSPSTLPGRWRCIAGVNGTGKSTILQALACVLLGDRGAQQLGGGLLQRMCRRQTEGEAKTEIVARLSNGHEELELFLPLGREGIDFQRLETHENINAMRDFWSWRGYHHLLVAYGAGRNLSERLDASMDRYSKDVQCQLTLFDPFAQVAHASVLTSRGALPAAVLAALRQLLESILQDSPVQVARSTEPLQFQVDGATVAASELPDGFRSLVAWLADLCASWYDQAPEEAKTGDLSRLHGIVLIDEIDLHLHPRLQRTLVPRLRRLLPNVQWVVTTHSPLVLASFDQNELVPLEGLSVEVRSLDRQILGFTVNDVYEWLMETEPTSAAMDELWASKQHDNDEGLGILLAQSRTVNAEQARRNWEWRKQRLEQFRQKKARSDEQK